MKNRILSVVLILLMIASILPMGLIGAFAANNSDNTRTIVSLKSGDWTFSYCEEELTYSYLGSGISNPKNYTCKGIATITKYNGSDKNVEIPEKITYENFEATISFPYNTQKKYTGEVEFTVTKISASCFNNSSPNNPNIETISIPASVSEISMYYASFCGKSLKSFSVAEENENFCSVDGVLYKKRNDLKKYTGEDYSHSYDVTGYSLLRFPNNYENENFEIPSVINDIPVLGIEPYAFYSCVLPELNITFANGSTIQVIDYCAFYTCMSLKSIRIPASVIYISDAKYDAFFGGNCGVFEDCQNLSTVIFEEGSQLKNIGSRAFYNCCAWDDYGEEIIGGLASINIPASVIIIDDYAFAECQNLSEVTFGKGSKLECIGKEAFYNCINLKELRIPNNIEIIDETAFFMDDDSDDNLIIYCHEGSASIAVIEELGLEYIIEPHVYGDWGNSEKEFLCTEDQHQIRTCEICDHTEERIIEAQYTEHDLNFEKAIEEGNFFKDREELWHCSRCSYSETRVVLSWFHRIINFIKGLLGIK